MAFSADSLKQQAFRLGFTLAGVTSAEPAPTLAAYLRWIETGKHGDMNYLARPDRRMRRENLRHILPKARSMILVGLNYYTAAVPLVALENPARGRIAAYAWGVDYHDLMTIRLKSLAEWLQSATGRGLSQRVYVDTGAILERAHAHQAGLGFIGKNTLLIHPRRGSYFFLGEILTDLEFNVYDTPGQFTRCGGCVRCLTTCPTNALSSPYELDARRCISYLTIEHKEWIPHELRSRMGNWIFGCDVCQDVCPWQRFTTPTTESAFYPPNDLARAAPLLLDLLKLSEPEFTAQFTGTPLLRSQRDRLVRNASIAAGNWGQAQAVPALQSLLDDASPLVRGHATWALTKIMGAEARPRLQKCLDRETDENARNEIAHNLSSLRAE